MAVDIRIGMVKIQRRRTRKKPPKVQLAESPTPAPGAATPGGAI